MPETFEAIRALSARETAARVNAGRLSAEAVAAAFSARIAEAEPAVGAWTFFEAGRAEAEARTVEAAAPLAGVTFGVKDVIDTADMPTTYGSAVYPDVRPASDAPCVALTRLKGGVVLGKTVSTEFAMTSPGKTRNPHNLAHTPGGSSSGSCAAVAAGMAHAAFATQTSGSTIRPASFCGVVGYKPSFGTLNRTSVKVLSDSLDTLALIARDVRDAAFAAAALADRPELAVPDAVSAPRIGLFRTPRWGQAEAATRDALTRAADALAAQGVVVVELPVPDWFDGLYDALVAIMGWETPRSLAYEYRVMGHRIAPPTKAFLDVLSRTSYGDYAAALALVADRAGKLAEILGSCDAALTPAAVGEAPLGLASTGDPVFNKPWTLLHGPCVCVPAGVGPAGLPVGVQVVGRLGEDAALLRAAAFVEDALRAGGVGPHRSLPQGDPRGHQ